MQDRDFKVEGKLEIGPTETYFDFFDGEYLGKLLLEHFKVPQELGYTDLGRVRITVEMLDEYD